jgi:catechol 2,3-dioxygenase-like lactoylglutathione lyase family enzyme
MEIMMSAPSPGSNPRNSSQAASIDLKLEVIVLPVSDVDRAKRFYGNMGWRLDADFSAGDDWRVVQYTPPGSSCSIHFGKGYTTAVPGTVQGLMLVVDDIIRARAELIERGVEVSDVFHFAGVANVTETKGRVSGRIRRATPTARGRRSAIRMATAGSCRK